MVCCAVKAPPSIVEGPPAGVMYFSDNTGEVIELKCRATGSPAPELVSSISYDLHVAVLTVSLKFVQLTIVSLSSKSLYNIACWTVGR